MKYTVSTRCAQPVYDLSDADDCRAARQFMGLSEERLADLAQVDVKEVVELEAGEAPSRWTWVVQALGRQLRALGLKTSAREVA